ncbi:PDR/VanB family oxidoreductase [Agromyces sp. NPDC049794]|uniref:PDR/VanB family oxidoreductase n=1 Tax=unclassified Agromyces TaxID=2639701 RepID=UPI0033E510EA
MDEPRIDVSVVDRIEGADGVAVVVLERPGGDAFPEWAPGAHIDVHLPGDMIRQFSLSSSPSDSRRWRLGVLREMAGRGGSAWIHESLVTGAKLSVSAPRNNFPLHEAPAYRFVAGGIGITPLLPMIADVSRTGADWSLLYGGRTRASMAFLDELQAYGDHVQFRPQDEFGLLDLKRFLSDPVPGEQIYACGPEPMLVAIEATVQHWPAHSLHLERFTAKEVSTTEDVAFEVEFAESGLTATVEPGVSILDVAENLGLNVFSSCREGTCGTCETPMLEGEADHRDSLLTSAEQAANDALMICVSRAAAGCPRLKLGL